MKKFGFWGNDENWESLCTQCGLCCYDRRLTPDGDLVVDFSSPCPHLDTENHTCTVYDNRFKACKECRKVNILHAVFSPYLPDSCGYARKYAKIRRLFVWRQDSSVPEELEPPVEDQG